MSETLADIAIPPQFPDHTQLPESDGTFVKNFQEHPQTIILTDSITQVLQNLHPDGQYCIGQDCGIYWRETDPPEKGAAAPDWFYVPGVPPRLDGKNRRSYVLWREYIPPLIAIELASGNCSAGSAILLVNNMHKHSLDLAQSPCCNPLLLLCHLSNFCVPDLAYNKHYHHLDLCKLLEYNPLLLLGSPLVNYKR